MATLTRKPMIVTAKYDTLQTKIIKFLTAISKMKYYRVKSIDALNK